MAKTKDQRLAEIHQRALRQFDDINSAIYDERQQCLEDRRFYSIAGAQWEGDLGSQFENKAKFEANKVHLSVIRIINEYRNNRITVDFVSKDGTKDDALADACDGLFRADMQDSDGEDASDNAFEEAVGGGYGAWRLRNEFEDEYDEDNDYQRIRFEPIYDADTSVYFDVNAKKQDMSDAEHCFVLVANSPEAYKERWGDDPASWDKTIHQCEYDWMTPDVVYVAEYYVVEEKRETIYTYQEIDGETVKYTAEELKDEDLQAVLSATGSVEVGRRRVIRRKVHKYIMSGSKVLEDSGYIAGTEIPIIPTYGKRWFVENVERCMGNVRLAKDSQRLQNMQLSKLGEIAALSPIEKPILTPEQIAGHQVMWEEDNLKNYPFLLINPITDQSGNESAGGPVAYTRPPEVPPAMAALLQITNENVKELTGNQERGEEIRANLSGEAIQLVQDRLDMQTYIYVSNLAKAMKRCGEVWLSMARDIYVEPGRKMKTIGRQQEIGTIDLQRPVEGENGTEYENDMTDAKFDVAVTVGPSTSSKRQSIIRNLTGIANFVDDPQDRQVLTNLILMNMEGEGLSDVTEFYRKKLVMAGVLQPTEEEAIQMQQQQNQPDPNQELVQAATTKELAEAERAVADTEKTNAETDKVRAQTAEIAQKMDAQEVKTTLEIVDAVTGAP